MASNLPPGVTVGMIEAHFADRPCELCGYMPDDCVCPVCPKCQSQGDPACYQEVDLGVCGGLREKGFTIQQKIGKAKRRICDLQEQIGDEELYIDYLESRLVEPDE